MDLALVLARLQFATTTIYHFLFVPLTLGLSILVAWFQTRYYFSGNEDFKRLTKYFGGLFIINFSLGVATGIVQEFQFGMNWSEYSRFVGDIFGAPLAIEALVAFFLESTLLGIWIFGWGKLPKKIHLACIWLVAIASSLSAFWIIVANSFMQEPVGYVLRNGRAEMTDFFAIITNQHVWLQFPHTLFSGFVTASIFVIAVSAYNILKKKEADVFIKSIKIAAIFGFVSLVILIGIGDLQGKYLVKNQPMKMAAAEALWESKEPAPLSIFAIIDEKNKTNKFDIGIPSALSFMSYNNFTSRVEGINDIQLQMEKELGPGNYIPPVTVTYWSFRIMVFVGLFMMLIYALIAYFVYIKKNIQDKKWLLKALIIALPLPYICNSTGWILAEIGRQPWIVYKILKTSDGLSKVVSSGYVLTSLIGFVLVYSVLAIFCAYLMIRYIRSGGSDGLIIDEKKEA